MKMDRKLVSQEPHELEYLARKHGVRIGVMRELVDHWGPSRRVIELAIADYIETGKVFRPIFSATEADVPLPAPTGTSDIPAPPAAGTITVMTLTEDDIDMDGPR